MAITGDIVHREITTVKYNTGDPREIDTTYELSDARIAEWDVTIPISTVVNIFDPVNDNAPPLPDFDFLRISTDNECRVEITCKEGDGNEVSFVHTIPAGGSYVIQKNGSTYGATGGIFAGTDADVDLIQVEEALGANICEIHILMARAA